MLRSFRIWLFAPRLIQMQNLTLSTDVLTWAADQIGRSYESLVEGLAKREKDRDRLLEGRLTPAQAEKVAKLTGVPFGLLFLSAPPTIRRPAIPDLRQTVDPLPLSKDFQEAYEDALRKQQWYAEHLKEAGAEPLPIVGKFNAKSSPADVAADIVSSLGISDTLRKTAATTEDYFSILAERIENLGVLVMKTGIVKSNTKRPLSVSEFRGFAVADKIAPLVFINGRDAEVAAVFTLIHEIAHIWTGQSGISDIGLAKTSNRGIEQLCNQVAADVLVPKDEFSQFWKTLGDVSAVAKKFRVSRIVVARRALDFGFIQYQEYSDIVNQSRMKPAKAGGGGDAYLTIPVRNSKKLTATIVRSTMAGETLLREAATLLHVKPDTIMELGRRGKIFG